MKNPLPFLLTVALGGYLMTRSSRRQNPSVETNEIPTSLDYNDPELRSVLSEDDDEDEGDEDADLAD